MKKDIIKEMIYVIMNNMNRLADTLLELVTEMRSIKERLAILEEISDVKVTQVSTTSEDVGLMVTDVDLKKGELRQISNKTYYITKK